MSENTTELGYWVISGEGLLDMLRRCHAGGDPDLVYAEEYANSEHSPQGQPCADLRRVLALIDNETEQHLPGDAGYDVTISRIHALVQSALGGDPQ